MVLDRNLFKEIEGKVRILVRNNNLDLVDFKIFPRGRSWVIRSIVDHESGGVTVDECSILNKVIFSVIEDSNMLGDNFVVEVNSPGLDRPLKSSKDFMRVKGKRIMVWLKESLRGKTYFEGKLLNVRDGSIILEVKNDIFEIPLNIINKSLQKIAQ
ncbi:MAG: hypothetical protein B1H08_02025 [Candidatus Omnitrophica bacterium 4484_171]|nr:MAG: hypothetical protein B1H08_02025 [Candidatus Omnitrophica bacterium 4484_171]